MANSVQQACNACGAFAPAAGEILGEPVFLVDDMVDSVFLVDDMVDSGWSLTACGVALARAGSGTVYPLVLAQTTAGLGGMTRLPR